MIILGVTLADAKRFRAQFTHIRRNEVVLGLNELFESFEALAAYASKSLNFELCKK